MSLKPEFVYATGPTLEDMRAGQVIVPLETYLPMADQRRSAWLEVPQTGTYYVAAHMYTAGERSSNGSLYMKRLSLSEPMHNGAPNVVTDILFNSHLTGEPMVDVTFRAPAVDVAGEPLSDITAVDVYRNDELIKQFGATTPGQQLTFTDEVPKGDLNYMYTFVATNSHGEGRHISVTSYVGVGAIAVPTDIAVYEDPAHLGELIVSWTPVFKNVDGVDLEPEAVAYGIVNTAGSIIGAVMASEGHVTITCCSPEENRFVGYRLLAMNAKTGAYYSTQMVRTPYVNVGKPYDMPQEDSFRKGILGLHWASDDFECDARGYTYDGRLVMPVGSRRPACYPVDGDGGMLAWDPSTAQDNAYAVIYLPKTVIPDVDEAGFRFCFFGTTAADCYEITPVAVDEHGKLLPLMEPITDGNKSENRWIQVTVPLKAYAGRALSLGFEMRCLSYKAVLCIDDIEIRTFHDYDLQATTLTGPQAIYSGNTSYVTATVQNRGAKRIDSFNITLQRDGEALQTQNISYILYPDWKVGVSMEVDADEMRAPYHDYTFVITDDSATDANNANNTSMPLRIATLASPLPAPENMEAVGEGLDVALSWTEPDVDAWSQTRLESFEDYECGTVDSAADWIFYDGDESITYTSSNFSFPGMGYTGAYIVMDIDKVRTSKQEVRDRLQPHTGTHCLLAFSAIYEANDDWIISPRLPGVAQTVSFWAKTYDMYFFSEQVQVMVSTTDASPQSFLPLGELIIVPEEWTEYTFDITSDVRYFAIRCVSNDRFVLMLDDISYRTHAAEAALTGYELYRDGVPMETAPVGPTTLTFADTPSPQGGTFTYNVAATYNIGRSSLSLPATVTTYDPAGIDGIAGTMVNIYAIDSCIIVEGAAGMPVTVAGVDGRLCAHTPEAPARYTVPVTPGVYIVTTPERVTKLMVR